jgi:hypothetical protein
LFSLELGSAAPEFSLLAFQLGSLAIDFGHALAPANAGGWMARTVSLSHPTQNASSPTVTN